MRPTRTQVIALQGPALVTVGLLLVVPTVLLAATSLSVGQPFSIALGGWTTSHYTRFAVDSHYRVELVRSLMIGAKTTILATLGGYFLAHWIRFRASRPNIWLIPISVSLIAGYIVRIYAWRTLLGPTGLVVSILSPFGLARDDQSILLFTSSAVVLAQVQVFLPFTSLILYFSMTKIDSRLIEQARTLGYTTTTAFWTVTLPLTGQALLGATCFTFFLSSGDYLTPALLGGLQGTTVGAVIAGQFQQLGNYSAGAALSFWMLLIFGIFFVALRQLMDGLALLPQR